jgi:hypothetical protein
MRIGDLVDPICWKEDKLILVKLNLGAATLHGHVASTRQYDVSGPESSAWQGNAPWTGQIAPTDDPASEGQAGER